MRMRKKKHGAERLEACGEILLERPGEPIKSPEEIFGRGGELRLEIGCGKGGFACGMAEKHPEANFIALERVNDVMVVAVEKAMLKKEQRSADNLRFMIARAEDLSEIFEKSSVDVIYLNFSDPWPKKGHAKRRLTYRTFLNSYFSILKNGGKLCFKTDNKGLFDFTLEELAELGVECDYVTYDLHSSEYAENNVMTEYETNFSSQGIPICALSLTNKK
ncbi:MAG: tRNA (guanosine(46)-N7)-methyltransferase TrmB [Ruminococcaceae bacterium]|nr:tRNA (guanosine(46)-N7)-methyltransferase TrmB [Oscillospiraceae bacterium]